MTKKICPCCRGLGKVPAKRGVHKCHLCGGTGERPDWMNKKRP
jgi:RecJ-like exonuclease